jgi:hypothetical protein
MRGCTSASSEKKLKSVVSTGSQFVDMPTTIARKPHLPDLAFLQRTVLAKISVSIDGQQLKKNGAPNICECLVVLGLLNALVDSPSLIYALVRMAWTFKWRLVSPDRPSIDSSLASGRQIALKVKALPEMGQHNLIHVDGTMTSSTESGLDPKVSVAGISAELGSWKKTVGTTSTPFTTFCLSATPNPGQLTWKWAKIEQSKNIRDPDLTYMFGFRFTFEEPFDAKQVQSGGPDTTPVTLSGDLAIEVTLCDLNVTFEPSFMQFRDYTLSYPQAALEIFRSDQCDMPLEEAWPVPGVQHFRCEGCGTAQSQTPTSVAPPLPA